MQYSWTLLFSLLLPLLGGLWLDNKLGTTPLFILIGSVLGILAATVGVARMAIRTFAQVAGDNADQEAGADDEEEPD
jgi:F0F1-type ATP synthase assembly protein I